MNAKPEDTTGLTKDAGWELGVRKTVDAALPEVWHYLLGSGLSVWLGDIDGIPTEKGAEYQTRDGVRGSIRGFTENFRIRLTWRPDDWPHDTTLQLTVKEAATGTTIGIHHEKLADRDERKLMLGHWKNVITALAHAIESQPRANASGSNRAVGRGRTRAGSGTWRSPSRE